MILLKHTARVALLILCSATSWAATRGPDASGYTATDTLVYSFSNIAGPGGGASVLAGTDDGTAVLTLPFSFQFYGQTYSMVCVSTNGALYFISSAAACNGLEIDFANADLSVAGPPTNPPALLPYWSDLSFQVSGAGAIFYQASGSPGNRRFVVQWNNAYPQGSQSPVTFQVVLSEGANSILFQYQTVDLGSANPASKGGQAAIGIRNSGAPANSQQIAWSFGAPVIGNGTAILFSADRIAPLTSAAPAPQPNPSGWNSATVTIGLNASDSGGSGVKQIQYSLAGAQSAPLQTLFSNSANVTISQEGTTTLTYFATDNNNNIEIAKTLTMKIDKRLPVIAGMPAAGCSLWPVNSKMVQVATVTASDALSGVAPGSFKIVGTSSEPPSNPPSSDIVITPLNGGYTIELRADRLGNGPGRVYRLIATVNDLAGNTLSVTAECTVPHDQKK